MTAAQFNQERLFFVLMTVFYGSGGIIMPVLPLFLSKSLSPGDMGILMAILPLSTISFQFLWGWIADRFGVAKVLMITIAGTMISAFGFMAADSFYEYFLVFVVYSFFSCPSGSLIDTLALSHDPDNFGKIRLWGAVGFGAAVIFSGVAVGYPMFIVHSILLFLSLATLFFIDRSKADGGADTVSIQGGLRLLGDKLLLFLLLLLFVLFTAIKSHEVFYAVGMDHLKASGWVLGLSLALGVFPEIGMFIWIDKLAVRTTNMRLLMIGVAVIVCRLSLLGFSQNLWVWSLSQVFEAVAFCFLYVGAVKKINEWVPAAYKATGQSLFSVFCYGFGGVAGSYASGLIVSQYNVFVLYRLCAFVCFFVLVGAWILSKIANQKSPLAKAGISG